MCGIKYNEKFIKKKPQTVSLFIFKILISSWLLCIVYMCTPDRWTSFERVICETSVNLAFPLVLLDPTGMVDGTFPVCDPEKLPVESRPPVIYLGQGEPVEQAIDTLRAAARQRDTIVVWKNFAQGKLDHYKDKEFAMNNFNNDSYYFLRNYSNYATKEMHLLDALENMDEYYLGFSYTLLANNPMIWQDINSMLSSYGDDLQSIIPVNNSKHHAFLYEGKKYHTGFHQAPVGDWFLQIANTKKWTFVQPKYSLYTKIISLDGLIVNSAWDFIPRDTNVPHIDILTEPGDLMYFPPHWWHEVENVGDEFGLAFGFRPKYDVMSVPLDLITPWRLQPGEMGHRLLLFCGIVKAVIHKWASTNENVSGVKSREQLMCKFSDIVHQYVPSWDWNKHSPPGSPGCADLKAENNFKKEL